MATFISATLPRIAPHLAAAFSLPAAEFANRIPA
jgi:hypothetical protein